LIPWNAEACFTRQVETRHWIDACDLCQTAKKPGRLSVRDLTIPLTIQLPCAITFRTFLEKDITSEAFSNTLNQWAMSRYDIREDVPDPAVK
jgi:hypothetical protein